jgi:tetratricopeptide (TPR) repeat protein
MRSRRSRVILIGLAGVALLLLVAVAMVAVYFLVRGRESATPSWQDPIAASQPAQVAADLALYPLAGSSELETVDVALAYDDLETAYATLVHSLEMTDAQRIGRLVLLGRQFLDAEQPERAAVTFQQVVDLAILSPHLPDPARADALLASGRGWAEMGLDSLALESYDQVYRLALPDSGSPYLQMANRRDLLAALESAYEALGAGEQAAACRDQILALDQAAPQPAAVPGPRPELPLGGDVVSTPEIGALEEARRQAAYALSEAVRQSGQAPAELVEGLAAALRAEDAAKLALYEQELAGTSQSSRRIGAQWQMVKWLMRKYQVASGNLGLSLVPEWESSLADIQSALSKAQEGLFFDYEDLVTALPDAALIGPGSYQVRRQALLDGRLGRYPNYPAEQLTSKLQDAVRGLIASGSVDRLYVDVSSQGVGEALRFLLSNWEEYGLSAQSP